MSACRIGIPVVLGKLIDWFSAADSNPIISNGEYDAYLWILFFLVVALTYAVALPRTLLYQQIQGHAIRVQVNTLLYKHVISIDSNSSGQLSTGHLINLMANDTLSYEQCLTNGVVGVLSVPCTGVILYLLFYNLGIASFAGLAIILFVTGLLLFVASKFGSLRQEIGKVADDRITLLEELINAMLVIKMYTWEVLFDKVKDKRNSEAKLLRLQATLSGIMFSLGFFSQHLTIIIIYVAAIYTNEDKAFKSSVVFTTVIYAAILQFYIKMAIMTVAEGVKIVKSNNRFQEVLMLPRDQSIERFKIF